MDDSGIVDLYLSRDESAISETSEKYGRKLRRIAYGILGNISSAEECENDTYLQAWDHIPPDEPRTCLFAFLGKITRHLAIDECRKNTSRKRYALFCELTQEMEECIPAGNDVEESFEAGVLTQFINSFLGNCSPEQRIIFVRRYWFFDTIPEIAGRYGYSRSKVKTTLFRLREGLKEHLRREGYSI